MQFDLLRWLAESHRNFHLAGPGLSEALLDELQSHGAWARGIVYEDFQLHYEPRSLARSPDGTKIVVGTKAGFLHPISWDGSRWRQGKEWQLVLEPRWQTEQKEKIARSIRAVRFLDNKTLIAGWGEGVFGLFSFSNTLICKDVIRVLPEEQVSSGRVREREWLGRFARFISLVPPPPSPPVGPNSAVMLGVTVGSQVHVLYRNGDIYSAKTYMPEEVLPKWGTGARVVDGVWSHAFLWVLDSSGHIYRYASCDIKASGLPGIPLRLVNSSLSKTRHREKALAAQGIFLLEHPREIGEFRAIAACVMGLAVLTSDDVTFLRFKMPRSGEDLPALEPASARWIAVPTAIDCSVCLPFCNYYKKRHLASQHIDQKNPVWTVVGTSQAGLQWIAWHDPKKGASSRLPAVVHAHRAGSGDSSVIQVRFGFHRQGPTYVACATRDHHLRISTLLDRYMTEQHLKSELPKAVEQNPELAAESGIAWWLLLQRIGSDFQRGLDAGGKITDERRRLMRFTQREDLYRLVRLLLNEWRSSKLASEVKRNLLRDWMCDVLGRAYQIDRFLSQELAKLAYDKIAQMRGNRGEVGRQLEADLGLFAAFLRKWVVYGHTYSEKTNDLLQLYSWNKQSGHVLDALTYLTKLLRRRVDPLWEARYVTVAPASAIWDLTTSPSGSFLLYSSTDGGIRAATDNGAMLTWEAGKSQSKALGQHYLEVYQGQLRHSLAEDFLGKYRHGPYARSLLISKASRENADIYLLVFSFRGWRREDQRDHSAGREARLYALLLSHVSDKLRIVAIDSKPLPDELYALYELASVSRSGERHVILGGTKGAWKFEDGWKVQPFIEIVANITKGKVALEIAQRSAIEVDVRGERSVFKRRLESVGREEFLPEMVHNPCWSLSSFIAAGGQLCIWAGFHDGRIRCFVAGKAGGGWEEAGRVQELDKEIHSRLRGSGFATSAPVWRLHVVQDQQVLIYGTADGIIGAVSLREHSDQRLHLIHHRELSPICGLLTYDDPEGGTRLLALTQGGVVILFDLELQHRLPSGSTRFSFPGLLLDRFALGHEARAIAAGLHDSELQRDLLGGPLPAVLVGSNEGSIFKYTLTLPGGSQRRKHAYQDWCTRLLEHKEVESVDGTRQPPPVTLFVGDNLYGWLRVLDVRDVHLLRFSISRELRTRWPLETISTLLEPICRHEYLAHLNGLADDIYGRRPLTPEPAKVIWEEAARVANHLAESALEREGEERDALLASFLELNRTIDDLCNRWIGSAQAIESRVLMHTFNCLFDWVSIVLIGLGTPSPVGTLVREFLLHNLIQRRLGFNDRIVYLEALRTINIAMLRSVRNVRTSTGELRWHLDLRPQLGEKERTGFYDLLAMVGDLGEQHAGSLTPADPLWTELSRFFAASLLLLPRSSFVISQVIAESRLTERDTHFAHAVKGQAEMILSTLTIAFTDKLALQQFDDSFDERIDGEAWQRLLLEAQEVAVGEPSGGYGAFSHEAFLLDHASAIRTASHLMKLTNTEVLPAREQEWLAKASRYFEHSRLYLRHMLDVWKAVRNKVSGDDGGTEPKGYSLPPASISSALQLCEEEEVYLMASADLFEPQRAQYLKIIGQWREQIWKRAEDAEGLLDVLDKFNRHTYRASSDRLMSSITELAFQNAPLWLDLLGAKPLRSEIERRLDAHPLVGAIFESGNRLVASTHLVGTVFAVARNYYRTSSAPAPHQTTLREINAALEKFCGFEELKPLWDGPRSEEIAAPGTLAVWDTVLQEVVTNTRKYCAIADRSLIVVCERNAGKVQLAFAGRRPFRNCIRDDYQAQIDDDQPEEALVFLQALAQKATEAGERLAATDPAEEGSSGMGLPLILRICRYLGMEAEVALEDPEMTRRKTREIPVMAKLNWPLCLKITWEEES